MVGVELRVARKDTEGPGDEGRDEDALLELDSAVDERVRGGGPPKPTALLLDMLVF